jgi:hypothetical protein
VEAGGRKHEGHVAAGDAEVEPEGRGEGPVPPSTCALVDEPPSTCALTAGAAHLLAAWWPEPPSTCMLEAGVGTGAHLLAAWWKGSICGGGVSSSQESGDGLRCLWVRL